MIKLNKIIFLTLLLISQTVIAKTENANALMTKNKVMRVIQINNINDVKNIEGPFYVAEVTVFSDRYSNPSLPSDPVVMDCHGEIIKIYPGNAARCESMEEGERATVRINAADFKLGADIQILVAK